MCKWSLPFIYFLGPQLSYTSGHTLESHVCMYIYCCRVCRCADVCACECMFMWKPEGNLGHHPLGNFHIVFSETGFLSGLVQTSGGFWGWDLENYWLSYLPSTPESPSEPQSHPMKISKMWGVRYYVDLPKDSCSWGERQKEEEGGRCFVWSQQGLDQETKAFATLCVNDGWSEGHKHASKLADICKADQDFKMIVFCS